MLIRLFLAALFLLPPLALAQSNFPGFPPGVFQSRGAIDAAPSGATNNLLLVDGISKLLLVDGASKLCLAGGC